MFSKRIANDLTPNRLARAVAEARAGGRALLDLTQSNPTRAGFQYPEDLLSALADPRGLTYEPSPLGVVSAREAVAADYARRGIVVNPDRVALTASTSEAYSLLFKVLCDPGDDVLVPQPSYPLFEHLTQLDGVTGLPYRLEYDGAWYVDVASVEAACTPRTRALLLVHPNNPTGSFVTPAELDALAMLCAARDIAVIVDEVFADYELADGARAAAASALSPSDCLVFSLGGLSKTAGLPQAKLGWIAAGGPDATVSAALERLEIACDTYLSVATPVQLAAPVVLSRSETVRAQIRTRIRANLQRAREAAAAVPACCLLRAEAGWSAIMQVPSLQTEEALVLELMIDDGVLVHPGYYFDFPRESFLVLSLLTPEAVFAEGLTRITRHFACSERTIP